MIFKNLQNFTFLDRSINQTVVVGTQRFGDDSRLKFFDCYFFHNFLTIKYKIYQKIKLNLWNLPETLSASIQYLFIMVVQLLSE